MPTVTLDFRKAPPAQAGGRQDYIKPGVHRFKVVKYDDTDSKSGKTMHTFTIQITRGEEKGKKLTEYFPMPKGARDSLFPLQKLHAFLIAAGAKNTVGKQVKIDLSRLVGKELSGEVGDERQEASTGANGQTFPARTVSRVFDYIDPKELSQQDADEDDEDEEDEDDEDDEDLDEDEEDEEDEDELDDEDDFPFDDDDDEEEEEEEPAPRRRGRPAAVATGTRKVKATAAPAKAKRSARR